MFSFVDPISPRIYSAHSSDVSHSLALPFTFEMYRNTVVFSSTFLRVCISLIPVIWACNMRFFTAVTLLIACSTLCIACQSSAHFFIFFLFSLKLIQSSCSFAFLPFTFKCLYSSTRRALSVASLGRSPSTLCQTASVSFLNFVLMRAKNVLSAGCCSFFYFIFFAVVITMKCVRIRSPVIYYMDVVYGDLQGY